MATSMDSQFKTSFDFFFLIAEILLFLVVVFFGFDSKTSNDKTRQLYTLAFHGLSHSATRVDISIQAPSHAYNFGNKRTL